MGTLTAAQHAVLTCRPIAQFRRAPRRVVGLRSGLRVVIGKRRFFLKLLRDIPDDSDVDGTSDTCENPSGPCRCAGMARRNASAGGSRRERWGAAEFTTENRELLRAR